MAVSWSHNEPVQFLRVDHMPCGKARKWCNDATTTVDGSSQISIAFIACTITWTEHQFSIRAYKKNILSEPLSVLVW